MVKYPDHEECYSFYAQVNSIINYFMTYCNLINYTCYIIKILSDKQAYEEVDSLLKKGSTHIPNSANLHVYRGKKYAYIF